MLTKRLFASCALCAATSLIAGRAGAQGQPGQQTPGLTRTELRRIEYPGNHVIVQMMVEIPAGSEVARHTHPGVESSYIIEGELALDVQGQPARTLRRGEAFQVPANMPHAARAGAGGPCRVFADFVVEKGKPLASPA